MPDTQPTAAAVRLIQGIATDITDALDSSVDKPLFTTEAQLMREWALRVDTYAAERIHEFHRVTDPLLDERDGLLLRAVTAEAERDVALAKLEAAMAGRDNIAREALQAIVARQRADFDRDALLADRDELVRRLATAEAELRIADALTLSLEPPRWRTRRDA